MKEGIELMNSFMRGTHFEKKLAKFQIDHNLCRDDILCGTIGSGWWYGFLRRNGYRIVNQQGEKFGVDRSDWTTLDNISQMYDIIYDEMVDAGVAEKLDTSMFMNKKGKLLRSFMNLEEKWIQNLLT